MHIELISCRKKCTTWLPQASLANNIQNELFASQWMDVMILHADLDIGSDRCLTTMLKDNEILLRKHVLIHEIDFTRSRPLTFYKNNISMLSCMH